MSYIGKTPTPAPLTSSDISDGIIITDKLATNAVVTSKITDGTIATADVANSAITNDKIASTIITGQTAETSIATDDLILLSDTSASGALKKMTRANFVSGIGGTNTPYWYAYGHASGQGSSSNTFTKMEATVVTQSSGSNYNDSNFRWTCPSGQGGKYWVSIATQPYATSVNGTGSQVVPYHNGNSKGNAYNASHYQISAFRNHWIMWSGIIAISAGDYLEAYYMTTFPSGSGGAAYGKFSGYKLIE